MKKSIDEIIASRTNNRFNTIAEDIPGEVSAIFFMYAAWSTSFLQLSFLIESLKNHPNIILYIFDIDQSNTEEIKNRFNVYSDGWGETFWLKQGHIILSIKKYSSNEINELVNNNINLIG